MTTFLVFVVTILLLVGIHELGHFLVAKALGMGVVEFAVGFGPALWTWQRGKTKYSLRLFPLGGYVRLAGEGAEATDFPEAETYYGRPAWVRFLVSLAGPTANVALAFVLAFAGFLLIGFPQLRVAGLIAGKPAEEVLAVGDVILAVQGKRILSTDDVGHIVQANAPGPIDFTVERAGQRLEVQITPVYDPEEKRYLVGAYFDPEVTLAGVRSTKALVPLAAAGLRPGDRVVEACGLPIRSFLELYESLNGGCREVLVERDVESLALELPDLPPNELLQGVEFTSLPMVYAPLGIGESGALAATQVSQAVSLIGATLRGIFTKEIPAGEAVSGPAGVAVILSQGLQAGPLVLILLIAVISVNVALFNLIPFPALDGSRTVFALWEMITRRRVPPKVETAIHAVGFVLLLGLLLVITAQDILRLFG